MKVLLVAFSIFISLQSFSHGGRTNSEGCHNQRSNGSYHCHNGSSATQTTPNTSTPAPYSTLYSRKSWKHWIDKDGDCMNTRQELLAAQSLIKVTKKKCTVKTGRWFDPYSGKYYTLASDLDIDHVVPLAWAHGHGAMNWNPEQKKQFANDEFNLLVVDDGLNQSKGAKSPDDWMPPNHSYRCEYVKKFNDVVGKYNLTYAPSEKRTINKMLNACGL